MDKLEKASTEKNLDKNLIPSDLDDFKSTKVIAIELISVMKNSKKNTEQINTTNINTVVTNTNNWKFNWGTLPKLIVLLYQFISLYLILIGIWDLVFNIIERIINKIF